MTERYAGCRVFPLLLAVLSFPSFPGFNSPLQAQEAVSPLTAAERTDFRETTRYDELVAFVSEVVGRNPDMHLTTMGTTYEGRSIPLVVVGRVADATPEAVRASGMTRVYVQGGIHAGEISGKEALLILLRELAAGEHGHWADSLVLLIAPLYNPDGNERVSPTNRRGQHGPVAGMGERPNAMGLDLNRTR
ncbi:MAG: M14 family zinc carboxypeptidase [Gemmatimonadota bacterium]